MAERLTLSECVERLDLAGRFKNPERVIRDRIRKFGIPYFKSGRSVELFEDHLEFLEGTFIKWPRKDGAEEGFTSIKTLRNPPTSTLKERSNSGTTTKKKRSRSNNLHTLITKRRLEASSIKSGNQ